MPKINVLPPSIAKLIAAGEVIDRPASVVKELVENALDAGATRITVELEHGGVTLLRVTDNGCGIEAQELPLAFIRHATSKIAQQSDLDKIGTLGFRGEALASIAAVSRVRVLSRTAQAAVGACYYIDGSGEAVLEEAGCAVGTSVEVRALFYNIPARMKFLKKDVVEGNAVATLLDRLALANPQVSFVLLRDGKRTLQTPGDGKLLSAVRVVNGAETAAAMLPVSLQLGDIAVTGLIAKPSVARSTRTMQSFFINSRYIHSKTCASAVEEAYKNRLMVGRFPACVLNLQIDCGQVDVNVHPAKLEVRFSNERAVYNAVYAACREALEQDERQPAPQRRDKITRFSLTDFDHRDRQLRLQTPPAAPAPATPTAAVLQPSPNRAGGAIVLRDRSGQRFSPLVTRPDLDIEKTIEEEQLPARLARLADGQGPEKAQQHAEIDPESDLALQRETPRFALDVDSADGLDAPDAFDAVSEASASQGAAAIQKQPAEPQENASQQVQGSYRLLGESADGLDAPDAFDAVSEASASQGAAVSQKQPAEPQENAPQQDIAPYRLLGELFETYLLIEQDEQFLLIDKHAAHERYLYDRLAGDNPAQERQQLLEPLAVTLSREEYFALTEQPQALQALGIVADDFGDGTLLVRELPMLLEGFAPAALLGQVAQQLLAQKSCATPAMLDELLHSVACRAAVMAGKSSKLPEQRQLADLVLGQPQIRHCPHGRPAVVRFSRREIEKMFGRIG